MAKSRRKACRKTGRPSVSKARSLRLSYIGHASFLLQGFGLNILLDPVWSARASPFEFAGPRRLLEPGVAFDDLPRIDAVLVSHNHYDHMDVGFFRASPANRAARSSSRSAMTQFFAPPTEA